MKPNVSKARHSFLSITIVSCLPRPGLACLPFFSLLRPAIIQEHRSGACLQFIRMQWVLGQPHKPCPLCPALSCHPPPRPWPTCAMLQVCMASAPAGAAGRNALPALCCPGKHLLAGQGSTPGVSGIPRRPPRCPPTCPAAFVTGWGLVGLHLVSPTRW